MGQHGDLSHHPTEIASQLGKTRVSVKCEEDCMDYAGNPAQESAHQRSAPLPPRHSGQGWLQSSWLVQRAR